MPRILLTCLFLLAATPARAMHIAEGVLPLPWAGLWFALALPFLALGLRRLNTLSREDLAMKPLVGLLAAVVFIISCLPIPVPTAGTCSHPCGTGIAAILVGPSVSVVISAVALLIQALLLGHGGLSSLGADLFSMGVVGAFAGYGLFRVLRGVGIPLGVAAFAAGLAVDWATYLTTALQLASGLRGSEPFWPLLGRIVLAFVPTQLPLGILEGAMTAGMVLLLQRKRPDLLRRMGVTAALAGLLLATALAPPPAQAAEKWPGVDEAVVGKFAREAGRPAQPLFGLEGDAQLFAFLLAGAAGGFAAGYYWRVLTERRQEPPGKG